MNSNLFKLDGRVALVTGASYGIGMAMAKALAQAGVDVFRLNFSHGSAQDHIERARLVRERDLAERLQHVVAGDVHLARLDVGVLVGLLQIEDQRHQRLGDEASAEQAEAAVVVRSGAEGIGRLLVQDEVLALASASLKRSRPVRKARGPRRQKPGSPPRP